MQPPHLVDDDLTPYTTFKFYVLSNSHDGLICVNMSVCFEFIHTPLIYPANTIHGIYISFKGKCLRSNSSPWFVMKTKSFRII